MATLAVLADLPWAGTPLADVAGRTADRPMPSASAADAAMTPSYDADPSGASAANIVSGRGRRRRMDRFDPDDDFFALGGDSVSAAAVARKVGKATGRPMCARALFEHPTSGTSRVRGGAATADAGRSGRAPIARRTRRRPARSGCAAEPAASDRSV